MADWLEIANTLINLQNQQRLSDISRTQQQTAGQIAIAEYQKQRDNALLSQLVDIVVKVRQSLQNRQFLDALLSSGIGIISFSQLYTEIVDADTKLKASDIQVKLLGTIRSTVSDQSAKSILQTSLTNYLLTFNSALQQALIQLKQFHGKLFWLDPSENWIVDIGEVVTPIQNVIDLSTKIVIFQKGNLYNVVDVNNSGIKGFYLINDYGRKWYLHFGENGGADLFAFFYPPLPAVEKEIALWELCCKIFDDDFLQANLPLVRTEMLNFFIKAFEHAKFTKQNLLAGIADYKQLRKIILNRALLAPEIQPHLKTNNQNEWLVFIIASIIIGFILLFIMPHC